MEKYNLIDTFFTDEKEYLDFLICKKQITIANDEATCFSELKKEDGYFLYTLTWLEDGKFIGDYVKPFRATTENIKVFNLGCKIIAERLSIYLDTQQANKVPSEPPAFGVLTHHK